MRAVLRVLSVTTFTLATAACSGAAPITVPATPADGTPTTAPTRSVTATPPASTVSTATPTPILTPVSSGTAAPTAAPPSAGEIDHPTDSNAIILRVEQTGGFVMPGFLFVRRPAFTLYGDGTVIYRPSDEGATFGDIQPPLQVARMDEDQVQALLRFALGPGRLIDARPQYLNPLIADAPDTLFTLNAGEYSKTVQVQALGIGRGQPADATDLAGLQALGDLLNDFGQQVLAGQATAVGPYEPRVYEGQLLGGDAPAAAGGREWPWPEITQAQLVKSGDGGPLRVILTAAQMRQLTTVPSGGLIGVEIRGPDDQAYQISIRPLLPDDPLTGPVR